MDPLSLTASVAGIISFCLKTAKALHKIRESYKHASVTIAALCSEASVISASLAQIQGILLKVIGASTSQFLTRPELRDAFDIALTGCTVTFSCLDHEIQCLAQGSNEKSEPGRKIKAKYVWKEETMKNLLLQIRGQQTAISLLIQSLQMQSLSDIQQLLHGNHTILEGIVSRTRSNRSLNPSLKIPASVLDAEPESNSLSDDYGSAISGTEFDFDDTIVNSRVYRRTMMIAEKTISDQCLQSVPVAQELHKTDTDTDKKCGGNGRQYSCGDLSKDPGIFTPSDPLIDQQVAGTVSSTRKHLLSRTRFAECPCRSQSFGEEDPQTHSKNFHESSCVEHSSAQGKIETPRKSSRRGRHCSQRQGSIVSRSCMDEEKFDLRPLPPTYQFSSRQNIDRLDSGFYSQAGEVVQISESSDMERRQSAACRQTRHGLPDPSLEQVIPEAMEATLKRLSGMSELPDVQKDPCALSTIWKEILRMQSTTLLDLADLVNDFGGLLSVGSYNGRSRLIQTEKQLFLGIEKLDGFSRAFREELEPFRQSRNFALPLGR